MHDILKSMATLLAVINPVVCGVMLISNEKGSEKKQRIGDATKAAVLILLILLVAAFAGRFILDIFGISMEAFQIVGGVIIASIGFSMFSPKPTAPDITDASSGCVSGIVTFAASPGTIATVITLAAVHDKAGLPMIAIGGILLAVSLTWVVMISSALAPDKGKNNNRQQMVTRFMGLILISMGLQFVLTGIKQFFFMS